MCDWCTYTVHARPAPTASAYRIGIPPPQKKTTYIELLESAQPKGVVDHEEDDNEHIDQREYGVDPQSTGSEDGGRVADGMKRGTLLEQVLHN